MSFLTIDGLPLLVALGSFKEQPREVGESGPAYSGALRRSRQAIKMDATFTTPPLALATAEAWRALLMGEGEVWDWETSHYGSKGTGPDSTTGLALATPTAAYGLGSLAIAAAAGPPTATYQVGFGSAWTVALWRKVAAGGFQHIILTSEGRQWVGGVEEAPPTTISGITTGGFGELILLGDVANDIWYDDLVALPFVVPAAWPPLLYAYGAAFPPLGNLAAAGDGLSRARTVQGFVTEVPSVAKGGARMSTLSVQLTEV